MRRVLAAAGGMWLTSVVACQALLDLKDAPASSDAGASVDAALDGGASDATADAPEAAVECGLGRFYCAAYRACVDRADPDFGCGAPDCRPCGGAHATEIRCAPADGGRLACRPSCASGFADCDGDPANGCETMLGTVSDCQACKASCKAASFCVTTAGTTECTASCSATVCGADCVNLDTSVAHCGKCLNPCPTAQNATARCTNGACALDCVAGSHLCGGGCVLDSDPANCGRECADCSAGLTNAVSVSCQNGTCAFACYAGFEDCDRIPSNGCETLGSCVQ